MAKPGLNMELNRLVQDQPPGQEGPRPGPPNPAEHLPNVPSYRPATTRIPVLVSRRTALSNSNFTKEIRSSIRRLGSVILPPSMRGMWPSRVSAWLGLSCHLCAMLWERALYSWEPRQTSLLLCSDLAGFSPFLSICLHLHTQQFSSSTACSLYRSSSYTGSHSHSS